MTLEKQVCSLELAKRLKELGVKQESLWFWRFLKGSNPEWDLAYSGNVRAVEKTYSAFTVAELGEMLPEDCKTRRPVDEKGKWLVDSLGTDRFFRADTEADARAAMLIYLLEQKLITLQ